jgi:Concanavalin A-like lectin/glucanases superfamily
MGSVYRFYINGELVASTVGTLGSVNTAPLQIGGSGGCSTFGGLIDEVEIFHRALSAHEIQAIFNAGSAGKCKEPDTVVIDGCNTGVPNTSLPSGSTISDLIAACAEGARNHGQFVSCVAHVTNELKKAGTITGRQKGSIQSCAAQANIP